MFASRANLGDIRSKRYGKRVRNLGEFRRQFFHSTILIKYLLCASHCVGSISSNMLFPGLAVDLWLSPASDLQHWFSNLNVHGNPLESLLKHSFLGPFLRDAYVACGSGAHDAAFLTSLQMKSKLLVWGPHFENHCSRTMNVIPELPFSLKPEICVNLNMKTKCRLADQKPGSFDTVACALWSEGGAWSYLLINSKLSFNDRIC